MTDRFFKLTDHLKLDFNLDAMIAKFDGDRIDPTGKNNYYSDPSGVLHWQYFTLTGPNVLFARNVYRNLKSESESIVHSLQNLQKYIDADSTIRENPMISEFLNHQINPDRISLMKQTAGSDIAPHFDRNRRLTLNIGLRNANAGKTYVSDSSDESNFATSDLQSYTMNDGDVYLLKTANVHSVKSLVTAESKLDRYIISYTILSR